MMTCNGTGELIGIHSVSVYENNGDLYHKYAVKWDSLEGNIAKQMSLYFNPFRRDYNKAREEYKKLLYDFYTAANGNTEWLQEDDVSKKAHEVIADLLKRYAVPYEYE